MVTFVWRFPRRELSIRVRTDSFANIEPCEDGYTTEAIGAVTSDECKPCQVGKFCKEGNTGPCDEGTICKRASQNKNGDNFDAASECNIDVENEIGAVVQIDCSIGQFGTNNE